MDIDIKKCLALVLVMAINLSPFIVANVDQNGKLALSGQAKYEFDPDVILSIFPRHDDTHLVTIYAHGRLSVSREESVLTGKSSINNIDYNRIASALMHAFQPGGIFSGDEYAAGQMERIRDIVAQLDPDGDESVGEQLGNLIKQRDKTASCVYFV